MWRTLGHEPHKKLLAQAWRRGALAHAYLLLGIDQIGRKRLALDIAKLANCQADATAEGPCDECRPCRRIEEGVHTDVVTLARGEATPARKGRNISIEQVHRLQERALLSPYEGGAQVFIIDGAEHLSIAAANALLKTIEEPPASVKILLIASSLDPLPSTIASRCHVVNMSPATAAAVGAALAGAELDEELRRRIEALAEGRIGWALQAARDPAELQLVEQALERCRALVDGDIQIRFAVARELSDRWRKQRHGVLKELDSWLVLWRNMARLKAAGGGTDAPGGSDAPGIPPDMAHLLERFSPSAIAATWQAIADARDLLERNATPRLALEAMALKIPPAGGGAG